MRESVQYIISEEDTYHNSSAKLIQARYVIYITRHTTQCQITFSANTTILRHVTAYTIPGTLLSAKQPSVPIQQS